MEIKDLKIGEIYYKKYASEWLFDHVSNNPYKCNNKCMTFNGRTFCNGNGAISEHNKNPDRLDAQHDLKVYNDTTKFLEETYASLTEEVELKEE